MTTQVGAERGTKSKKVTTCTACGYRRACDELSRAVEAWNRQLYHLTENLLHFCHNNSKPNKLCASVPLNFSSCVVYLRITTKNLEFPLIIKRSRLFFSSRPVISRT